MERDRHEGQSQQSINSQNNDASHNDDSVSSEPPEHPYLERFSTHQSLGPDAPIECRESIVEIPDEVYDRLPKHRKLVLVLLLSFCAFLAPISSTTVLAAVPEVAAEYNTTGIIINLSNAIYMLCMGISPMIWGPISQVYGRRWVMTAVGFLGCSIGTALAPNLAAFFVFRILTAIEGTSFILVGSAVISDIYRPTERGTAIGWFLSGTLIGPAFGPFVGGIIVTHTSWRVIFWLQTGLAGVAVVGSFFLLPETIYHKKIDDLSGYSGVEKGKVLWGMINPWRVIKLYEYPNLLLTGLGSASLLWNMYSLLSPIRYILNPRFNLTTPMQAGLFYLAPGCGYFLGTFAGGRYADYVVKKYIQKRGVRIPEDRMYSALPFMGIVIPACVLVYGWCVETNRGGIPLVVIVLFLQGFAQLFCFPSLNSYCLDVMPGRTGEVVAGNYVFRYILACAGTACVLPAVEVMGVGWFCTISVVLLILSSLGILATVWWGKSWRDKVDAKKKAKRLTEKPSHRGAAQGLGGNAHIATPAAETQRKDEV
ncbi:major facilitator superfamily domain-containing protein [Pseudomassariella vexata]|uniref:Major facilitator superfamily domain-containing protein n=1 Tax=Pseudomassariella vexata TaxID=1141098 RepID=A0A1Y2EBH6_9PEZI|nr:major facilitator superfamily domain-containing protein [Pseudomassariella vexata]ORY68767.1 major facilitator superfamily domain-containing protein [Pseudomassariella vexata]